MQAVPWRCYPRHSLFFVPDKMVVIRHTIPNFPQLLSAAQFSYKILLCGLLFGAHFAHREFWAALLSAAQFLFFLDGKELLFTAHLPREPQDSCCCYSEHNSFSVSILGPNSKVVIRSTIPRKTPKIPRKYSIFVVIGSTFPGFSLLYTAQFQFLVLLEYTAHFPGKLPPEKSMDVVIDGTVPLQKFFFADCYSAHILFCGDLTAEFFCPGRGCYGAHSSRNFAQGCYPRHNSIFLSRPLRSDREKPPKKIFFAIVMDGTLLRNAQFSGYIRHSRVGILRTIQLLFST